MENPTILLVEDEQADAVLTLRALMRNNMGDKVYVVRDGVEALDFLFCINKYADRDPNDLPRLTLLDLELPRVNGLEVLRRVRADERTCELPIVMVSSSTDEQTILESYKSGANAFVSKPADYTEYLESIRQLSSYWLLLNKALPEKDKQ